MEIILIAAMAANRVIGKDNTIPWKIPGEQGKFKKITMGHAVVMGRKTWDSLEGPLPGRRNIVVTRNKKLQTTGCEIVHSLNSALHICQKDKKVFIIGGAQLYALAIESADMLILTILDRAVEGDTFFPDFSAKNTFKLISSEEITFPEKYTCTIYKKRKRNHT